MIHQQWAEPHERERTDTRTRGSLRGDTARRQCKGPEALDSARETLHPTHGNDVGQLMHLSRQRWRHTLRRVICSLAQHRCHRYHCRPIPSPARGASLANGKQKQKRAGSSGRGGMVTELQKKVLRAANNTALLAPPLKRGVPLQPSTGSSRSSGGASRGPPQPPEPMRHVAVGEGEAGEGEAGPKH